MPKTEGDADQLTQVVLNLILNAEQAIAASGRGGRVALRAETRDGRLSLVVEDDGPGVPQELRKRVFEPFFTTKGVGQGTGLDLSMGHQIVSAHGGTIRIDEAQSGGARVVIDLPAAPDTNAALPDPSTFPPRGPKALRVLIVDDEADVAELNAEVLTRAGYLTTSVARGQDALRCLEAEDFDIVLSDLTMPDLDGRALFDAISRLHPKLVAGVGFITGDTLGKTSQTFLAEARRPDLEKPVSPNELREFVGRISQDCLT